MKTLPLSLIAACFSLSLPCLATAETPKSLAVGNKPESVTRGFGGHLYTSIINGNEPGDGSIKVVIGDDVKDFATGLENPKGIVFVGDHLVTADMKTLWMIDEKGNKKILAEEKDFPQALSMLNDVAVAADGKGVYVTDMGANSKMRDPQGNLWPIDSAEAKELPSIGRVYHVDLSGKVSLAVDSSPEMPCPNGVSAPDKDTLLVGEFFYGNLLEIKNGKITVLNTGFRGADAIERDANGDIYVSSWTQGKVWKLDPQGKNPVVIAEGFKSAADFYFDLKGRQIILPDMISGTLHFLPIP